MSSPDVSVVIVTYNSADVLEGCLAALPSGPRYQLIVIDNQSSDGSVALARRVRPDALVIENTTNAGFAVAVNTAAQYATARYILLLNPDASIEEDSLAGLVGSADTMPDVAITAPLVSDSAHSFRTVAAGRFPTVWRMFTHAFGISRLGGVLPFFQGHYLLHRQLPRRSEVDVDWVSGGCMLVRADLWRSMGGLSERWFMYAEDIELCLRARRAGYRVLLNTSYRATHEIGGSSSNVDGRIGTQWLVNLYDLYRWKLARNEFQSFCWKLIVVLGFRLRAVAARVFSKRERRHYTSTRFRSYAIGLSREPTSLDR